MYIIYIYIYMYIDNAEPHIAWQRLVTLSAQEADLEPLVPSGPVAHTVEVLASSFFRSCKFYIYTYISIYIYIYIYTYLYTYIYVATWNACIHTDMHAYIHMIGVLEELEVQLFPRRFFTGITKKKS